MTSLSDYFIIGDLHTIALVSRTGAIDWLCFPQIDSPSIFGSLLDEQRGGTWQLAELEQFTVTSAYIPNTAMVEHQLSALDGSGRCTMIDYMLPRPTTQTNISHFLIRQLLAEQAMTLTFRFSPRPDYARAMPQYSASAQKLTIPCGVGQLQLHLPPQTELVSAGEDYLITVRLLAHEQTNLILEYTPGQSEKLPVNRAEYTRDFWINWLSQGKFFDVYRNDLIRSAITLKLLQFYPTGAIIAAATMSLPAVLGGPRNWDYRYVWIRDASFTLYAFYLLGFTEEANRFFSFIEGIAARNQVTRAPFRLNTMYDIWGQPAPTEMELNHLSGYADSKPVRLGNAATNQFQLDLYGSLLDAYYFMSKVGVRISPAGQELIIHMANTILDQWTSTDYSIWEIRQQPQQYTYSKVMSWVGLDRAVHLAKDWPTVSAKRDLWQTGAQTIAAWIWQNCFHTESARLVQHPATSQLDASNFMFVLLGFLNRHEERTKKIITQTAQDLVIQEYLVYRYKIDDGIAAPEEAFLICSFWYIAALAAIGEHARAEQLLDKLRAHLSPTGLMPEDLDTGTTTYLGNFPQAYSHVGFITAAYYIQHYRSARS